jgi:hypothetical protein
MADVKGGLEAGADTIIVKPADANGTVNVKIGNVRRCTSFLLSCGTAAHSFCRPLQDSDRMAKLPKEKLVRRPRWR